MSLVVALDLGTTRIKGGRLDERHRLTGLVSRDAPALEGEGVVRESSAESYLEATTDALRELLGDERRGAKLGVASQRSTFALWSADTGEPITTLISWQDRRAAEWCARHGSLEPTVRRLTGLPLSPHYAGPKLAALAERRPGLRESLACGAVSFGTLETLVVHHLSAGRSHETDPTMAARTLMADPRSPRWLPELLDHFGAPLAALPSILPTAGRATSLTGGTTLAASVADQAAGALAAIGDRADSVLVNLGTGGFVLAPTGSEMMPRDGYLAGPLIGLETRTRYALEGTINGAAVAVDRFGPPPTELPDRDPAPEAFALPDAAGVGSPYWIAERGLTLSPQAERLDGPGKRRVVAEGIVFRVRQLVEDLRPSARITLGGGLRRDPFFGAAIAACLDRPVAVLEEPETTLLGAAWLAAGRPLAALRPRTRAAAPCEAGSYLRDKYPRWRRWLERLLSD